jgi:ribosomal 50S subunit-associated protein YjgA (DUF615 family)
MHRTKETEKLYRLEEERERIIKECATEWARLSGVDQKDFWTISLPTTLFDLLNSYGRNISTTAAKRYLEFIEKGS